MRPWPRRAVPATLIFAIVRPGPARWVPETSAARAKLFPEAADLAESSNDPIGRFEAINLLVPTLMEQASPDSYNDELDAAAQTATEVHEPFIRWISPFIRGCVAIARGQLELAEDLVALAFALSDWATGWSQDGSRERSVGALAEAARRTGLAGRGAQVGCLDPASGPAHNQRQAGIEAPGRMPKCRTRVLLLLT